LAILLCDSSVIAIRISEWCNFYDIHISQSSAATCLKRGGIFKHQFAANLLASPLVKKIENRIIVGEVMAKSLVSCFLTHGVVHREDPTM